MNITLFGVNITAHIKVPKLLLFCGSKLTAAQFIDHKLNFHFTGAELHYSHTAPCT